MDAGTPRVLIADSLDAEQLSPLHDLGVVVLERMGIAQDELIREIGSCDGLVVRSRTKVTAELFAAAPRLRVVGRAGTGVDNIDLEAATRSGVVVMNVPGGNAVAAAEHTIALMMALARRIPAAAASLRAGAWERAGFAGIELAGRTLGVVGLGRIGREVALRARGLRMKVIGYDPLIASTMAEDLAVELMPLEELVGQVDFLTVHVPLTEATRHLVGRKLLARARPGLRILNVARGGIVDEAALLEALAEGRVAGAALDVFEEEPPRNRALLDHPAVVATPHLGASTLEAQAGVARAIARQVGHFLVEGIVENAVNAPGVDAETRERIEPWMRLARSLGGVAAGCAAGGIHAVDLTLQGEISAQPRPLFEAEVLLGLIRPFVGDRTNQVNAPVLAKERGIRVSFAQRPSHRTFQSLIQIAVHHDGDPIKLSGTLFGIDNLRIVRAFGFNIDAIPEGPMLLCANDDMPGIIGHLGTVLGAAGINIANMSVGRDPERGRALAVLNLDAEPPPAVLAELSSRPGIHWLRHLSGAHLP